MYSHTVAHPPVYTASFWNPATEHSYLQPLLMMAATPITTPHPHHLINNIQHIYINTIAADPLLPALTLRARRFYFEVQFSTLFACFVINIGFKTR